MSIGDSIAGMYAAFGTVMALFQRERVKVPLYQSIIDVALNEAMLSVMESLIPDYLAYGVTRQRVGGRMEGIAPSNAYPCADGTNIVVAGNGDAIFERYMQTIGAPTRRGPGAADQRRPWRRREELDHAIGEWTIHYNRDDALKLSTRQVSRPGPSTPPRTSAPTTVRGPEHDPELRCHTGRRRSGQSDSPASCR